MSRISSKLPRLERLVLSLGTRQSTRAAEELFARDTLVASTNAFDYYYEHYTRVEYEAFGAEK